MSSYVQLLIVFQAEQVKLDAERAFEDCSDVARLEVSSRLIIGIVD